MPSGMRILSPTFLFAACPLQSLYARRQKISAKPANNFKFQCMPEKKSLLSSKPPEQHRRGETLSNQKFVTEFLANNKQIYLTIQYLCCLLFFKSWLKLSHIILFSSLIKCSLLLLSSSVLLQRWFLAQFSFLGESIGFLLLVCLQI